MDGKTLRYIRKLRDLGATRIEIDDVVIEFRDAVEVDSAPVADVPPSVRQELDDAILEAQEAMADHREVEGMEEQAQRRRKLERLKYSHS